MPTPPRSRILLLIALAGTTAASDAPIILDDAVTMTGATATVNVVANDTGATGWDVQEVADPDGIASVSSGQLAIDVTGKAAGTYTVTYTLAKAGETVKPILKASLPRGVLTTVTTAGQSVTVYDSGFGSAMARVPGSSTDFYFMTDRGPNVDGPSGSKVFPVLGFQPNIARFRLGSDGRMTLVSRMGLTSEVGAPLNGLPNKDANANTTETAYAYGDLANNLGLLANANGADPEGLAIAGDGSMWISDEYAPFLLRLNASGQITRRILPEAGVSSGAAPKLPLVLAKRTPNRGAEGLCLTPSGTYVILMMQNGLMNGLSESNAKKCAAVRIVRHHIATGVNEEFVHLLEDLQDGVASPGNTKKPRLSAVAAIDDNTLLVVERDDAFPGGSLDGSFHFRKIFRVSLAGASNVTDPANSATGLLYGGSTIEALCDNDAKATAATALSGHGIVPVTKTEEYDLLAYGGTGDNVTGTLGRQYLHDKIEGLAIIDGSTIPARIAICNDDDFGIGGPGDGSITAKTNPDGIADFNEVMFLNRAGTLTVTVPSANVAPTFIKGPDVTTTEDKGAYTFSTATSGYSAYPGTDSASAGTALACGYKTDDGNIAWLAGDPSTGGNRTANDGSLKTIAESVREGGNPKAIGIVSTVELSHATPAAFVSHNKSRNNYWQIGDEIINAVKPEVVIGAGHPAWESSGYRYIGPADSKTDATNYNKLKDGTAGYTFRERVAGTATAGADLKTAAASATMLFGLYGGSSGYFEQPTPTGAIVDGLGEFAWSSAAKENPSLADATTAALTVLAKDTDGFFAMVEGGDIDWANHANHYTWMLGATYQFDLAVRAGESFIDTAGGPEWSDTLFIVTSDHGNSYMRFGDRTLGQGELPTLFSAAGGIPSDGSILFGGLAYSTSSAFNSHTNEMTGWYARSGSAAALALFDEYTGAGAKSWYGTSGILDNTQIYEVMRRALGLAGSDGAAALGTPVKHVVLWIGDGMQLAHEIAYGRYRYGNDDGVTWRNGANWSKRGFCTTWDKTTYDRYAKNAADPTDAGNAAKQAPAYDRTTFLANPTLYAGIGYDVAKGGTAGYPEQATPSDAYFLTKVPLWATRILDGNGDAVTFTCTNDNNALFSVQPAVSTKGELTFTTASNKNGTATVTVTPVDARGLAGASQTFSITITPVADAPVASAVPTIGATGTVLVGARMTATAGTWSDADGDAMTVAYQWQRATSSTGANAVGIAGATSATYDLVEADRGMYVRVVVTTTDATGAVVTSASAWTAVPATGGGVASSSDDDDDGGCGNGAAGILLLGLLGILGLRRLR